MTEEKSDRSVALQRGARLGPYEIVSFLGAGGMGEVYRARDTRLLREVAIKVLPAEIASDRERLKRFEREARAASALNHPNIVTIHDIGSADGVSYIAMELVEGDSLRKLLVGGALPIKKLLPIAAQLADGLARAHEAGIVHRDLKPENVMVGKDARVKILDFGLAKRRVLPAAQDETATPTETATDARVVLGTVGYMSPEQVAGKDVDLRSDQFSFGAVLYEMATGRRAFQKKTAAETMAAILNDEPQPVAATGPQAPTPLRWIIERCLAKDPEERYAATRDLARDLATARDRISEIGSGESPLAPRRRIARTAPVVALAAGLAALAAAYFLGERRGREKAALPTFRQLTFRHGGVQSARFTSDGRTVVYAAAWDGDPLRLFSTRIESPGSVQLELPSADVAAVSSSAELLVFPGRAFDSLNSPDPSTLARVPLAGGTPRMLAERVFFADWSPDAGSVAAVLEDGNGDRRLEFPIGKILLKAGALSAGSSLRVSPDGHLVAFYTYAPTVSVSVADLSGKTKVLTSGWKDSGMYLAWSPRGDEVWFTASKGGWSSSLSAVSLSGRERVLLRLPGWINLQDISPDGRVLLSFGKNRKGIRCRLAGWEKERDLSWFDFSGFRGLSADGGSLLFDEQGETAPVATGYLRRTDGSPPQRLGEVVPISFSPDGTRVLAHDAQGRYLVLPTGPGEPKYLPTKSGLEYRGASSWLPDGRVLSVLEERGHRRTYAIDIEEGKLEALTPDGYTCWHSSPDGKSALCWTPEGRRRYSFESKELFEIPGLEDDDEILQWSADGKSLFVQPGSDVADAARIYRLELATGKREVWRELGPIEPAGLVRIRLRAGLTPDGGSYCYNTVYRQSDLYLVEGLR